MLRAVVMSISVSVLGIACAPPDTVMIQAEFRNQGPKPVALAVSTLSDAHLANAVRPPSVPAASTTKVRFWVPADGDGWIVVGGLNLIAWSDLMPYASRPDCELFINLPAEMDFTLGCVGQEGGTAAPIDPYR